MAEYIIVGVDPGTTSSVAALDLSGNVLGMHSSKDMGLSAVVDYIVSLGKPSLVASDVNPAPSFVSDVAVKFGSPLFVPPKSLSVNEKLDMTRPYECSDAHQRDALAAALYAYQQYNNKFRKIDALGLGERVKHLVLQGKSISVAASLLKEETQPTGGKAEPEVIKSTPPEPSSEQKQIRELERRVKILHSVIEERDNRIRLLKEQLAESKRIGHTRGEVKPQTEKRIQTLQVMLSQAKDAQKILAQAAAGEVILVPIYPQSLHGYTLMEHEGADLKGIKIAFTSNKRVREKLLSHRITVYDSKNLLEHQGIYYISASALEHLDDVPQPKADLERIIQDYRQRRD